MNTQHEFGAIFILSHSTESQLDITKYIPTVTVTPTGSLPYRDIPD